MERASRRHRVPRARGRGSRRARRDVTHWLAWGLDPSSGALPGGTPAPTEGRNGFGGNGYRGPCPPRGGPHRYVFRLYALDTPLALEPGADAGAFRTALTGHVLGTGELTGIFGRG